MELTTAKHTKAGPDGQAAAPVTASACFVILWVKGQSDAHIEQEILRDLNQHAGVVSARFSRERPHLMIVSYDPSTTRSRAIRDVVSRPNAAARIVGC